ncbi:MFS transporter [Microbacterium sp. B2969]|uniref:MFS transporter n=1 Tax=Microbacterium alkaliflavum TaxID=3248839 RepID=A0ABW7Q9D2_9MICO
MPRSPRHATMLAQAAALAWGLQFAFLTPTLALLLTDLLGATAAQVGLVLALYNASGFVASLIVPAWADRRHEYLTPMVVCGILTLALAVALALAGTIPIAAIALIVLGGPAGTGASLFFAHLRAAGWGRSAVMGARAMISVAWVAGPPLAMLLAGTFGTRSILVALVVIAIAGIVLIVAMRRGGTDPGTAAVQADQQSTPLSRVRITGVLAAFVALQATNAAITSVMTLFAVDDLGLNPIWGGIALGVAALAEIPALFLLGRLSTRFGPVALLIVGSTVGIAFYAVMAVVHDPVTLVLAQLLNAWFFATVAGVGLTWFQDIIPRPGLASGLFTNTRRIGSILAGGLIALAGTSAGYSGTFVACAAVTATALVLIVAVGLRRAPGRDGVPGEPATG